MKTITVETPAPATAKEALQFTMEDRNWKHDPIDLNSTDGIKRNIDALWASLKALADYVDGEAKGATHQVTVPDRYEADGSTSLSHPVSADDPAQPAFVDESVRYQARPSPRV